jgi:DNA-binding IclR family transcriptional regulator
LSAVSWGLLLKALFEPQLEIDISDLAKRLGVAKSAAHQLAVMLVTKQCSRRGHIRAR